MDKKFKDWLGKKEKIHSSKKGLNFVSPGEIVWGYIGVNIGFEQDGKGEDFERPILIISKIGSMYFGIPMTTQGKKDSFFNYRIKSVNFGFNSDLIISQGKMFDINRFGEVIGKVSKKELDDIKKILRNKYFPRS